MRFAAWLAWSSFSLFVMLVAFDLLLGSRIAAEQMLGPAINGLLALPFPAMGALLASRRPDNPIGWLFCVSAILLGLSDVGGRYALDALVAEPGALGGHLEIVSRPAGGTRLIALLPARELVHA